MGPMVLPESMTSRRANSSARSVSAVAKWHAANGSLVRRIDASQPRPAYGFDEGAADQHALVAEYQVRYGFPGPPSRSLLVLSLEMQGSEGSSDLEHT